MKGQRVLKITSIIGEGKGREKEVWLKHGFCIVGSWMIAIFFYQTDENP